MGHVAGGLCLPYPSMLLATTMSVFKLPIALASHACAPLSLVAGCDTLPSPAPVVATIFGQITCFKIPLAKPSQGNKPTQANEAKELSFSFSALSRDMRPPTVPVQPDSAPTWTPSLTPSPSPSPSLSLSLWRVVVCKLFASLLSRGINLQAIDRCCQRASQADGQTRQPLLLLLLLPTLACQSALLRQDKIIYSAAPAPTPFSLLPRTPSLQLSTRELASDRSSLRVLVIKAI